jgi:two-component system response regulator AtoC
VKRKKLILSVDDEADIRETVKDVLKDAGFAVETAVDGKDCLNKLKKIKPDLILLDILMPGLTTKEIMDGIKKKYPEVPIILLTVVKLSEATKKKMIGSNHVGYIEKPFDNADLIRRIKKAVGD